MPFAPFDLTGKVALVTGGNGGIGLGMAEGLAQAGADVAIWGRNADKMASAKEKLNATGVKVLAQQVDVTDEKAVDAAMQEIADTFGRLDCCIANAGTGFGRSRFEEMPTELWKKTMETNLDSAFYTLRAASRLMVERARGGEPGGSLVAISSMSAVSGAPGNQPYATTKSAMTGMMKGIAVEYGRYGIRANTVLPGWTMTDLAAPALESEGFEKHVLPRVPVKRWGTPEDFAGIAVYLASDASSYFTGQEVMIDGGYIVF
ncbi:SDR family NAD(P)-dependent oxidoreductase [Erythrobacter sp. HKB08]|uniref:SDR family NAD(P)-dependent oxidoreductase n=1 Tax=Erythrobacter sp. HKB08 TaxID=2502843 RepID=UPI0010090481|nr:SDR family oxidoreductase [Erythrobacter sp. HKB08]